jgi:hypothetical protein
MQHYYETATVVNSNCSRTTYRIYSLAQDKHTSPRAWTGRDIGGHSKSHQTFATMRMEMKMKVMKPATRMCCQSGPHCALSTKGACPRPLCSPRHERPHSTGRAFAMLRRRA